MALLWPWGIEWSHSEHWGGGGGKGLRSDLTVIPSMTLMVAARVTHPPEVTCGWKWGCRWCGGQNLQVNAAPGGLQKAGASECLLYASHDHPSALLPPPEGWVRPPHPCGTVLPPASQDAAAFGGGVSRDVVQLQCGHEGGPSSSRTGVRDGRDRETRTQRALGRPREEGGLRGTSLPT